MDYIIRKLKKTEINLLDDFLYETIYQRDQNNLLPRKIIKEPELYVYIKDFGQKDDHCLVAEMQGQIIGAVWTRILAGEIKGFGNLDKATPEFAISIYQEYRGEGIGTKLMQKMLQLLKEKGYAKTSLAVQKDNYALKMYERIGFKIIAEKQEEYVMVYDLENNTVD